jgi:PAS domain S-box-containing protein
MTKPCEQPRGDPPAALRDRIIGLGERSIRKSYYPQLRRQLEEIERSRNSLEEKSAALQDMLRDLEEARSSLAESESRYRSLVENINDVILSLDGRGRVSYISPVIQNYGGRRPEDVIGQPFTVFVHPEDRPALVSAFPCVLAGNAEPQEFRLLGKDGAIRHMRMSGRPMLDEGRVVGLTAVMSDITEQKQAEEAIRTLNEELEQRVAERTARLETANQDLKAFAYSVSHDLRAPLRHLDGYISLLKESMATADEQSRHYIDAVSASARFMTALIDDLLSFSRMARVEMMRTQVDLRDLALEVIRDLEPETEGRAVDWRVGQLPVVTGDGAMLRVALANLLSNAVKFTRRRARADIEIGCLPAEEGQVTVYVRDNGVGFDMRCADKLFGVFQRLHRAEEFEGTGIGLANTRRVVERHGGRTWAEAKIDGGATFSFSLPQGRVKSSPKGLKAPERTAGGRGDVQQPSDRPRSP